VWLTMLLHAHGARVLRIKGLLHVRDLPAPVVVHGVQHVIHPPAHLERWPDGDRRSRIVFIVRDMNPATIEASLAAFNRQAGRPAPAV
jgi:G3E family GTPase